ncbi:hypothetical protein, partial [Cytobacillus firmus]|uniref:hypothetical protein n=1 Tax=Cytobacillus firmus TaxID=1399 RepID=UPI0030026DAF
SFQRSIRRSEATLLIYHSHDSMSTSFFKLFFHRVVVTTFNILSPSKRTVNRNTKKDLKTKTAA